MSKCLFVCMYMCTVVLVLDGEAEDVAGPEARAVVHATVEEWVRVGILDVEDLTRGGHMASDALVCRDPELLLQPRRKWAHKWNIRQTAEEHQSQRHEWDRGRQVQTVQSGVSPPRHLRRHHQRPWPPTRG